MGLMSSLRVICKDNNHPVNGKSRATVKLHLSEVHLNEIHPGLTERL